MDFKQSIEYSTNSVANGFLNIFYKLVLSTKTYFTKLKGCDKTTYNEVSCR